MAYVRREYPEWSWSFSRKQIFQSCARKYYYHYYASHNGWETNAGALAALCYRLKKLGNLYTTLGEAVHQAAERLFTSTLPRGNSVSEVEIEERIRKHMRAVFRASRDGRDEFMRRPNRNPMLFEFYYGDGPSEAAIAKINARIRACTENLVKSKTLAEFTDHDCQLLQCEQFDSFMIEETKVFAIPDLLYRKDSTNMWVIVDWKTGEAYQENLEQLGLYALYTAAKYQVDPKTIIIRLEYLESGEAKEYQFSQEELEAVEKDTLTSIEQMRTLLVDPEENIARDLSYFPITANTYQCKLCNFYELCKEELDIREGEQDGEQAQGVS